MSMRRHRHSRQASVDYPKYMPLNSTTQQPPPIDIMPAPAVLPPVQPSDYESDNQGGYTSDYPVTKPPASRTKDDLNLLVLQRHNPEIAQILSVAPFATLYEWAPGEELGSEPGWQKTSTVGSLFICKLDEGIYNEQRFLALLFNRGNDKNFSVELRQSDETHIEVQGDFIIITRKEPDAKVELNALYIFAGEPGTSTANSREVNGGLMVELANIAQKSRDAAEAQAESQQHLPVPLPVQEPDPVADQTHDYHHFHTFDHGPAYPSHQSHYYPQIHDPAYQQGPPPPHQPSPTPQIAPQPHRQVDLLALLQGGQPQSDVESNAGHYQPPPQPQPHPPPNNHLLELFRTSNPQPQQPSAAQPSVNDLFKQAGVKIG